MSKVLLNVFFMLTFFLVSCAFAEDSGVLVSSPAQIENRSDALDSLSGGQESKDDQNDGSSQKATANNGANKADDDIIVKSTNVIMFQMTANLKLTPDQINTVEPIVKDNVIKVRDLQLSLEAGNINSKEMFDQRADLTKAENTQLNSILTPAQMKEWLDIQNEYHN